VCPRPCDSLPSLPVRWESPATGLGIPPGATSEPHVFRGRSNPGQRGTASTSVKRAFGWGGILAILKRRCPEVRLSVNRNHTWEEQAISLIDLPSYSVPSRRESVAYRSFVHLDVGFRICRIQR